MSSCNGTDRGLKTEIYFFVEHDFTRKRADFSKVSFLRENMANRQKKQKQMTALPSGTAGAASHNNCGNTSALTPYAYRKGNAKKGCYTTQCRAASSLMRLAFERLEPYDGKLSRTVFRGGNASNGVSLPGV